MKLRIRVGAALVPAILIAGSVLAQSINIDFSPEGSPAPSASYGAAGLPGVWNSILGLPPTQYSLVGLDGLPSGVTLSQYGGTEVINDPLIKPSDPAGDDANLLRDALVTHTTVETCLFFHGLTNGHYEVLTYAWMPVHIAIRSNVHHDTNPIFTLVGGSWPGQHTLGVSYARHIVGVTTGFLGPHSGVPSGGNYTVGAALNGIQLRLLAPEASLSVSRTDLSWAAMPQADSYDVVRGDLGALLANAGDFSVATDPCVEDGFTSTSLPYAFDPAPGAGDWFLVRGVAASGNLTWDGPGDSQVASRNAGIAVSAGSCP